MQKHLKRSLGTKDLLEANIRAKPVLAEFDRIIAKASSRLSTVTSPTIKRTSLNDTEIARMADRSCAGDRRDVRRRQHDSVDAEQAVQDSLYTGRDARKQSR